MDQNLITSMVRFDMRTIHLQKRNIKAGNDIMEDAREVFGVPSGDSVQSLRTLHMVNRKYVVNFV